MNKAIIICLLFFVSKYCFAQTMQLERYAIDDTNTPVAEKLIFQKKHGRSDEYLTEIGGQKWFWSSGENIFFELKQKHYQKIIENLPNYYVEEEGSVVASNNTDNSTSNLQIRPKYMQNPYSIELKKGYTILNKSQYLAVVENYESLQRTECKCSRIRKIFSSCPCFQEAWGSYEQKCNALR